MFCPNENAPMHQAAVSSHYGQKVIIDQCEKCGGIWFDAFELFRIKQGEAREIEALDPDRLRAPTGIDHPTLLCPRDQVALSQYSDRNFPEGIVLMRCPKCQGFWLNRGGFTQYQESRQKLKLPREKTLEDQKLDEDVKRLLKSHYAGSGRDALLKAGKFLSASEGNNTLFPNGSRQGSSGEKNTLDSILDVLILLLRLFIFRH